MEVTSKNFPKFFCLIVRESFPTNLIFSLHEAISNILPEIFFIKEGCPVISIFLSPVELRVIKSVLA